jgi:hypothetical protein
MFSDIRMLSDFGFVTVIDLAVSLVGVLLVLPAVITLAEDHRLRPLSAGWTRRAPVLGDIARQRRRRQAVGA